MSAKSPQRPDDNAADARTERFVALMNQHQGRLSAFVESLVADFSAAQDILQDTNLILWRKRDNFRDGTNYWAWACKIAYNEVLHHRRTLSRSKLVFGDVLLEQLAAVTEERLEMHPDRTRLMRDCVEELSDRQRTAIQLRYSGTTTVAEIAEQQGTTANAVSKLLQRGRDALLECVERKLAEEERS